MKIKFIRTNLETGNEYVGEFNATHDFRFSDNVKVSTNTKLLLAENLIALWNFQQPKNWKYRIHID